MSQFILLTGSTGLVGRYLVRDLLLNGQRLALLVRPSKKQGVHERIEEILQMWEGELGTRLQRPVCLAGDVSEPGLGLDRDDRRWVSQHCDRVLHNAAILTFYGADREGEPWRTNLEGTRHMLQLCREVGLRDLHYVSTAYVCGQRQGVIREDELDCGQDFRNDYEHSKLLAEKLVREADFLRQLTVYRPAVIAGDSRTGYTSTYHGLYMYLQLMAVINRNTQPDENGVRHTNIRLNMTGDEPRNIVPVDWVSEVICHLLNTPAAHGRTYHLSPINPITPREIVTAGYKFFNSCGVEFCGQEATVQNDLNPIERATYDNKTMYEPYEHSDPKFDTTNLLKFAGHLPCPPIDEAMLARFLKFGEEDRWGRRKPAPLEPYVSVADLLHASMAACEAPIDGAAAGGSANGVGNRRGERQEIGLDISGPGGGQWLVVFDDRRLIQVERGLPAEEENAPVLRMEAAQFVELLRRGEPLAWRGATDENRTIAAFHKLFSSLSTGALAATAER